jgi:hypothetical protein
MHVGFKFGDIGWWMPGVILIVQRYELSPDGISEIGMLCGQASCIGEYDIV